MDDVTPGGRPSAALLVLTLLSLGTCAPLTQVREPYSDLS